ncbi:peptidyl-tRNA hydrolase [Candidatus Woesearchaeota archaeon]|nr:peptidyl-tRNA hydrolase [Candidatus Woesearchaeota archaeon]
MKSYKQVILVRQDLKLSKGKMSAQVAHASVDALLKSHKDIISEWHEQGMKKSVLKVKDEKELFEYKQKAEDAGLLTALVIDAGHTEIPAETKTCLGIGPDEESKIDKVTGRLKLA